ncbi:MAG: hypothetical protein JXA93_15765 [Anaerolineae bacterium]|nr:hypothetical protein [Anaerolineae bacterium]
MTEQIHSSHDKASSKPRPPQPATEELDLLAPSQILSPLAIQQTRLKPGRLSPHEVLQLQRAVGNRTVSQLLDKNMDQRPVAQIKQVGPGGVNNVIQRTLYSDVEKKAKKQTTSQKITQHELENAIKEFLVDLVKGQGYLDAGGNPVGLAEMQAVNFMWDTDYGAVPGLVLLPSQADVINDIRNGVFKIALRHEMGHYIRDIAHQPAAFQDVETVINGIDWNGLKATYPQGDMTNWKEEVRADLKGVRLRYIEERRFPTKSELSAYQTMLGPTVDNAHPPAAFRVQTIKTFISRIKPSKLCYLTTACVEARGLPDDCEELTLLRYFRDIYLLKQPHGEALVELYYKYAPGIVEKITHDPHRDVIYEYIYKVLRDCVDAIKRGEMKYTHLKYCEMVVTLKELFLPEDVIDGSRLRDEVRVPWWPSIYQAERELEPARTPPAPPPTWAIAPRSCSPPPPPHPPPPASSAARPAPSPLIFWPKHNVFRPGSPLVNRVASTPGSLFRTRRKPQKSLRPLHLPLAATDL